MIRMRRGLLVLHVFACCCVALCIAGKGSERSYDSNLDYPLPPPTKDEYGRGIRQPKILQDDCHFQGDRVSYHHQRFIAKVDEALKAISTILNTTRHPILPEASNHSYDDKYELVDVMTNTLIASSLTVLQKLGSHNDNHDALQLQKVLKKVQKEKLSVTLRFTMNQQCKFDKKTERKLVVSETEIEKSNGGDGMWSRLTSSTENVKIKKTVQEYHYKIKAPYKLSLIIGDDDDHEEIKLQSQNNNTMVKTITLLSGLNQKPPPSPIKTQVYDLKVDVTWLFQHILLLQQEGDTISSEFSVDRLSESCKTPRRNNQINTAMYVRTEFQKWIRRVLRVLYDLDTAVLSNNQKEEEEATQTTTVFEHIENNLPPVFSPIIPLFEHSSILPQSDYDTFLSKHDQSLDKVIQKLNYITIGQLSRGGILSKDEATMIVLLDHLHELFTTWADSIGYVENMLQNQLIQAVGKKLTAKDFDEFLSFYSKKIFGPEYSPRPFSYAVRRKDHYPDGIISIETTKDNNNMKSGGVPVDTTTRRISGDTSPPIFIPVDAATAVEIQGDRFVHGWIQHRWGSQKNKEHTLLARAHQFSSFMVILGVMGGSNTFIPKDAIILQNKDEVLIPLLTNVLPSAKEFKDSIASLSPEQRAFAEAYRQMQLESSVFGICIIQIKPQLERLLNLPEGSLTKEIQLTQDLMSLFVDYQIPSDLLSFDGPNDASVSDKVSEVKHHVQAVMDVITKTKATQLGDEKQKAKMRENMEWDTLGRMEGVERERDDVGNHIGRGPAGAQPYSSQSKQKRYQKNWVYSDDLDGAFADYSSQQSRSSKPPKNPDFVKDLYSGTLSNAQLMDSEAARSAPEEHVQLEESAESVHQDDNESFDEIKHQDKLVQDQSLSDEFTLIPKILDAKFEQTDKDGALKSTIIKTGKFWTRNRQENLLVVSKKEMLDSSTVKSEKNKAMDLLTAISRSGSLPLKSSELHVLVAVSHCFEKQIMETIIQDNINPIEKLERSMMMIASVIHGVAENELKVDGGKKNDVVIEGGKGILAEDITKTSKTES